MSAIEQTRPVFHQNTVPSPPVESISGDMPKMLQRARYEMENRRAQCTKAEDIEEKPIFRSENNNRRIFEIMSADIGAIRVISRIKIVMLIMQSLASVATVIVSVGYPAHAITAVNTIVVVSASMIIVAALLHNWQRSIIREITLNND